MRNEASDTRFFFPAALTALVGLAVACTSADQGAAPQQGVPEGGVLAEAGTSPQGDGAVGPSLLEDESGKALPTLEAPVDALAGDVDIVGAVQDAATNGAVSGATVRVGNVQTTTDARGRFAAKAPRGHALLTVQAPGHSAMVRQIGLGDQNPPLEIRLAPHTASADVGPGGHSFSSAGAAVEFPAGAYATPAKISVAFVSNPAAFSGDVLFTMPDGRAARLLNEIDVDTGVQPAAPATVRVPVPVDVDPAKVALYTLDEQTGTWVDPVRPTAIDNGVASYRVSHFSHKGQVHEGSDAVGVVTQCGSSGRGIAIDRQVCALMMKLRDRSKIQPNGGRVEIQMRSASRLTLGGDQAAHEVRDEDAVSRSAVESTCEGPACSTSVRYASPPPKPGPLTELHKKYPLIVRSRAVVMGVRGTVFAWDSHGCPREGAGDRASGQLAVQAGSVDIQSSGAAKAMTAGSRMRLCVGCSSPREAACCYKFESGCGGASGGGGGSPPPCPGGPGTTWVCDDQRRYTCRPDGACEQPPASASVVSPVRCGGDDQCPPTVPRCLTTASVPREGSCLPKEPIETFGWNESVVPVDPLPPPGGSSSSGGSGGGSGG